MIRGIEPRDLRVAIVSASGVAYGSRVFTVSTGWTELRFEFTPLASDPSAFFEIDLGRSDGGVWIDAAAFGPPDPGFVP